MLGSLLSFAVGLVVVLWPDASACAAPEAAELLFSLNSQVREDLRTHFAFLTFPYVVKTRLTIDGELSVRLEITTESIRHPSEIQELSSGLRSGLERFLAREYPNLLLAGDSRVVICRPFSFTQNLPSLSATLASGPVIGNDSPAPAVETAGSIAVPPESGRRSPVSAAAPNAQEVDVRGRISRAFGRRYVVKSLKLSLSSEEGLATVYLCLSATTEGPQKDRDRLSHAAKTLSEVLSVVGSLKPSAGSVVRFAFKKQADGLAVPALETVYGRKGWTLQTAEPPLTSVRSGSSSVRKERVRDPSSADRPGGHSRRMKPRVCCPEPPCAQSYEDMVSVPSCRIGPKGSISGRIQGLARRVKPGFYSRGKELSTVLFGESISISTAENLQCSFGYQRLYQTDEFFDGTKVHDVGNAAVFSLKYLSPPALKPNLRLGVGTDFALGSRRDRAIRTSDDDPGTDSFWAAFEAQATERSIFHIMIKRIGFYSRAFEFTQVALAGEWLPHHPLRRVYVEVMADDRRHQSFAELGTMIGSAFYVNVGLEASLGRSSSLLLGIPHVFSSVCKEMSLSIVRRL